jgi:alanine racemase
MIDARAPHPAGSGPAASDPAGSGPAVTATRHPLVEIAEGAAPPPLPKTAWLEIDLDAIVANVRLLGGLIPPESRVQPVVKADAYGHGAVAVSRALVGAGVESLAVATFDEGLELRQAGIDVPIAVLFPIPADLAQAALRHRLSITVGDHELSRRTFDALAGLGDLPLDEQLAVHLELETGLGRGGVDVSDARELAERIEACPQTRLAGLWTHLQAAGNPAITRAQHDRFGAGAILLEAAGIALPARHVSASGGILAATAGALDAVRIGVSAYGLVPDGLAVDERNRAAAAGLRPAMALRARPVRVAALPAGWGVSYGPTFTTSRPSVVATLPIGYADGWPRSLSNKAQVLVRGSRVPQVGTVAMDALMVDVTDVPGPAVTIDDEFTLIGRQGSDEITAHEVGRWCNTISYEVVSAMSGRLPRVYYAAAKPAAIRTVSCEAS